MSAKTVLAVLFGGKSSEYEVSLSSAYAVLSNVDGEKYDLVKIGITRSGEWYLYEGPLDAIADGSWCRLADALTPVAVDPAAGKRTLLFFAAEGLVKKQIDVVFPVLHGTFGEDGTLQGLLSMAGIPTVGCGCMASALCMDKAMTKAALNACGVRQAKAVVVRRSQIPAEAERVAREIKESLGYPIFVKPSRAGSSVGVSKVKTEEALFAALEKAFLEDEKVVVEECIFGKEIEVAVLEEHGCYTVSVPAEIEPGTEFYDYETKYVSDCAKYYIPARLDAEKTEEIRRRAEYIFRALDCRGLSRVDFFVTDAGDVILNEVNTLPGFTPISMYPKLMIHKGLTYGELIDRLVSAAL